MCTILRWELGLCTSMPLIKVFLVLHFTLWTIFWYRPTLRLLMIGWSCCNRPMTLRNSIVTFQECQSSHRIQNSFNDQSINFINDLIYLFLIMFVFYLLFLLSFVISEDIEDFSTLKEYYLRELRDENYYEEFID